MKQFIVHLFLGLVWLLMPLAASAQDGDLVFVTVERPPFSMTDGAGEQTGFSIDLMRAIAVELGRDVRFEKVDTFGDMFAAIDAAEVDGAVANISITAAREETMDFSQPIFESGIQIMLPETDRGSNLFNALFTWDLALFILFAFGVLFVFGMIMWAFERSRQPYFERPFREALFPSFWWALNLVVNGGFEERVPQSRVGRFFGVLLVVSSLFIVSVFVAKITAAMTVAAITETVDNLNDLDGRKTATTAGSTGAALLEARDISHRTYPTLAALLEAFEEGRAEAVVFDGPILAWYLQSNDDVDGRLVERVFKRENYGIALPTGSPLAEDINRALLALRESGTHDALRRKYFGD